MHECSPHTWPCFCAQINVKNLDSIHTVLNAIFFSPSCPPNQVLFMKMFPKSLFPDTSTSIAHADLQVSGMHRHENKCKSRRKDLSILIRKAWNFYQVQAPEAACMSWAKSITGKVYTQHRSKEILQLQFFMKGICLSADATILYCADDADEKFNISSKLKTKIVGSLTIHEDVWVKPYKLAMQASGQWRSSKLLLMTFNDDKTRKRTKKYITGIYLIWGRIIKKLWSSAYQMK